MHHLQCASVTVLAHESESKYLYNSTDSLVTAHSVTEAPQYG